MQSAAIPSTSTAASTSSLASTLTASARHSSSHHYLHHDDQPRSSVLRQHSDEERPIKSTMLQTNGSVRPASKARRTSSGGSRIPSEDVGQYRGSQTGSSASDSGSEWRHGPKTHSTAASSFPIQASASSSSPSAVLADARSDLGSTRNADKMPDRASTSSNYFDKAALAVASQSDAQRGGSESSRSAHLDLAEYPAQELLRLLAALLAQIAAANDQLRPKGVSTPSPSASVELKQKAKDQSNDMTTTSSNTSITSLQDGKGQASKLNGDNQPGSNTSSPGISRRPTTAALSALQAPSSTLCFHARNIPSISIESYLLRILKYCPATNEVFLSLLIYFDRMSKMGAPSIAKAGATSSAEGARTSDGSTLNLTEQEENGSGKQMHAGMRGFAIDSYNVHRLVIAGVTVASKFFSDVFYTNSRYAKVGGLPVHELNQLELQFLLLNDFKLVIPLEEMQRYADQLLVYGGAPQSTWSDTSPSGEEDHARSKSRGVSPRRTTKSSDVSMRER